MKIQSYSKAELDGFREKINDKQLLQALFSKNKPDENAILNELAKDSYVRRFGRMRRDVDVGQWKKNGNSDNERHGSCGSVSDGNKFSTSSAPNQQHKPHFKGFGSATKIPRRQPRFLARAGCTTASGGRHFSSPAAVDDTQPTFDEFGMPVFTTAKGHSKGGFCSAKSPPINNRFGHGGGGAASPSRNNFGPINYGMPRGVFVTDRRQRIRINSSNNGSAVSNQWDSVVAAMDNAVKHQPLSSSSTFSANSSPSPLNSPAPFFEAGGNQKNAPKHKMRKDTPYVKPDAEGGYVKFKRNCAAKKHQMRMANGEGKVFMSTSDENFDEAKEVVDAGGHGGAVGKSDEHDDDKVIFTEASSSDSEGEFFEAPVDHYGALLLLDSDAANHADVENNDEDFSFDCDGGEKILMPKVFDAHVTAYLHYFKLINEGLAKLFARL